MRTMILGVVAALGIMMASTGEASAQRLRARMAVNSGWYGNNYYPSYYSNGWYSPGYYSSGYYYPSYYSSGYYDNSWYSPGYYSSGYYSPGYYDSGYYNTYYGGWYPGSYFVDRYAPRASQIIRGRW